MSELTDHLVAQARRDVVHVAWDEFDAGIAELVHFLDVQGDQPRRLEPIGAQAIRKPEGAAAFVRAEFQNGRGRQIPDQLPVNLEIERAFQGRDALVATVRRPALDRLGEVRPVSHEVLIQSARKGPAPEEGSRAALRCPASVQISMEIACRFFNGCEGNPGVLLGSLNGGVAPAYRPLNIEFRRHFNNRQ